MNGMNELLLDVYLRDEESAGEVLLASAHTEGNEKPDREFMQNMAKACVARGIDPAKAIATVIERRLRILEHFTKRSSLPCKSIKIRLSSEPKAP